MDGGGCLQSDMVGEEGVVYRVRWCGGGWLSTE